MRRALFCILLCGAAASEDAVRLKRGGALRGTVVDEDPGSLLLELPSGSIRIPREAIESVERGPRVPRKRRELREDWFLLFEGEGGRVRGWRRTAEAKSEEALRVEETTVFFRAGGGEEVATQRVEESGPDGAPRSFFYRERYGGREEIVSGDVRAGRAAVMVSRDGTREMREVRLASGTVLPLPAFVSFLAEAEPGARVTRSALDARRLATAPLILRRESDAADPADPRLRPCRAALAVEGERTARALYRPGEGTVRVEWGGASLVARRVPRERVALAMRAFEPPKGLTVEEALLYPFHARGEALERIDPAAGVAITPPDATWTVSAAPGARGRILSFERRATFATVDLFVLDLPEGEPGMAGCLRRAFAQLRLTVERVGEPSPVRVSDCGGFSACGVTVEAVHRGEELVCLLHVVRAEDRCVLLAAAAPKRWWPLAEPAFERFRRSLVVTR